LLQNHAASSLSVGPAIYRYFETAATWPDAQTSCEALGTGWNLATISSAAENTAVANWAPENVWIGLNYVNSEWKWSSELSVSFTSWDTGEPNNLAGETAAFLKGSTDPFKGKWNNIPPASSVRYLCSVSYSHCQCTSLAIPALKVLLRLSYYASMRELVFFHRKSSSMYRLGVWLHAYMCVLSCHDCTSDLFLRKMPCSCIECTDYY
jgi:hypothetical protein